MTRERTVQREVHTRPEFSPVVDIYDQGGEIVLVADMPGVPGEAVELHLDRGVLTLQGKAKPTPSEGQMVYQEFQVEDFMRTFRLTEDIDAAGIAAEFQNGVLTIRLPKAAEKKSRKIPVKSG